MGRVSIIIIEIINFVFLILGIIIMCNSLYLHAGARSVCEKAPHWPAITAALIMIVVSFLGLMGCCFKDNCLLMIYLSLIFVIIVGIMGVTIFAFLVSISKGQEGRLEDFSKWLQKMVANENNWDTIKTCFVQAQLCTTIANHMHTNGYFHQMDFSPLQSGCCRPPTFCDLANKNATIYVPIYENVRNDCITWKNDEKEALFCYDCDSCKAGFLQYFRDEFRVMVIHNILTIVALMLIYFIGCCARRGIKYRYISYSAYVKA